MREIELVDYDPYCSFVNATVVVFVDGFMSFRSDLAAI